MPSGLESIWTYVDPSTMQGVAAGIVLGVVGVLILASWSYLSRLGLEAETGSAFGDLCGTDGFVRKRVLLRGRLIAQGTVREQPVRLLLCFRRGQACWVLSWKSGGGSFVRDSLAREMTVPLARWIDEEVEHASIV